MDLSRQDWLIAMLGALALHLLLAAGVWLAQRSAAPAPNSTPRGVMVSLDNLSAGPPPPASIKNMPIENLKPNNTVGQAPEAAPASPGNAKASPSPAPEAAVPAPSSAETSPSPAPEAAPAVGPEPSSRLPATQSGGPGNVASASGSANAQSAATPAIASAVTVHPSNTLADIRPQQQVTAHSARLNAPGVAANSAQQSHNGAFGNSETATQNYMVRLHGWLSRHKNYPPAARQKKIEGTVRLYLVINRSGQVVAHHIAQSSGSKLLDKAVEQMLVHSEPLPGMPAAMQRNRLELVIPIVFTLH